MSAQESNDDGQPLELNTGLSENSTGEFDEVARDSATFPGGTAEPAGIPQKSRPAVPNYPPHAANSASESSATDRPARALAEPPARQGSFLSWAVMLLVLLITSLPMIVALLHAPDVTERNEARTMATSIATRQHMVTTEGRPFSMKRIIPYLNDQQRIVQPPGTTWLHLAAGAAWDPSSENVDRFVLSARLSSLAFALLTVAAVFWAGHSIAGRTTAAFAALICAANPLFLYHGGLATEAIYHTGWAMLSIAAALWAIRPLKPPPGVERQLIGWVTCGLALGAATLTAGPITLATILLPILLLLLLCPNRVGHLLGLLAAVLIGGLLVVPWALTAYEQEPGIWGQWLDQMGLMPAPSAEQLGKIGGMRVLLMIAALLPWTLWLIGAIVQPFSTSSAGRRVRMFLGLTWFATAVATLLFTPLRLPVTGALLPVIPVAAVLIALIFHQYCDLAAQGRYARFWRALRWPHLLLLGLASLAVPWAMFLQDMLVEKNLIDQAVVNHIHWSVALGLSAALLVIVGLSLHWTIKGYPARALWAWAIWTLGLTGAVFMPLSTGPLAATALHDEAPQIGTIAGKTPVRFFDPTGSADEPDPVLLLYAHRSLRPIGLEQIKEKIRRQEEFYLLTPQQDEPPNEHLKLSHRFEATAMTLWRYLPSNGPEPNENRPAEQTGGAS